MYAKLLEHFGQGGARPRDDCSVGHPLPGVEVRDVDGEGREVEGNEEVVAFVELVPNARASPGQLLEFAAASLAPYKRPAEIVVMAALPATAAGKVLKARLAQIARGGKPR